MTLNFFGNDALLYSPRPQIVAQTLRIAAFLPLQHCSAIKLKHDFGVTDYIFLESLCRYQVMISYHYGCQNGQNLWKEQEILIDIWTFYRLGKRWYDVCHVRVRCLAKQLFYWIGAIGKRCHATLRCAASGSYGSTHPRYPQPLHQCQLCPGIRFKVQHVPIENFVPTLSSIL